MELSGSLCECTDCGLVFKGERAFDTHRKHGRCLTDPRTLRGKGLIRIEGVWRRRGPYSP